MQIILNGKPEVLNKDTNTVHDLLNNLSIKQNNVAVEINLELVPRSLYQSHQIKDGDKIEIIHFVGGG
jgi:thiamine biosynthesis protein ThiS